MTKKSSKTRFILLAILVAIGVLLSVVKFDIPFTTTTYNGFINSIPLGLDLQGGVSAVFEASLPAESTETDLDTALDATVKRVESLLSSKNFTNANVQKQGNNQLRVEVPNQTDATEILKLIGTPANLKITKENNANAEAVMTGKHIQNATVGYQDADGDGNADYGVVLTFTKEGKRLFADLTGEISESGDTIYIFVGDDTNPITQLKANGAITNGSTFISGSNMTSYESANEFALKILSGSFNTNLKMLQSTTISASLGKNAILFGSISICVAIVVIMALLYVFYGDLGLLADFAMIVFAVLYLFLLQSVPSVQLSLAGFAGLLLSVSLLVISFVTTFQKIKEEYSEGKKIPMSVKNGFNKSIAPVADLHAVSAISALVLWIVGSGTIKSFALVFLLGTFVSAFVSLWVIRRFVKIYLPLNSTKAYKLRLKREAHVDEI